MKRSYSFHDPEILSELATELSWSHFIELLPLKTEEARLYYAQDAAQRGYSTKELRRQISRKAYDMQVQRRQEPKNCLLILRSSPDK